MTPLPLPPLTLEVLLLEAGDPAVLLGLLPKGDPRELAGDAGDAERRLSSVDLLPVPLARVERRRLA
jgi:hypothetical protein